eukprot:6472051-Amphidinium_carterae.2
MFVMVCLPNLVHQFLFFAIRFWVLALVTPNSWSTHRDIDGMLLTIEMIKKALPKMALIENVLGFDQKSCPEEKNTAMDFFLSKLEELGYYSLVTDSNLQYWHQVTRKRCQSCIPQETEPPDPQRQKIKRNEFTLPLQVEVSLMQDLSQMAWQTSELQKHESWET